MKIEMKEDERFDSIDVEGAKTDFNFKQFFDGFDTSMLTISEFECDQKPWVLESASFDCSCMEVPKEPEDTTNKFFPVLDTNKPTVTIWMAGYSVTGNYSSAQIIGRFNARNLIEAMDQYMALDESKSVRAHSDGSYSIWACKLYDNEAEARKHCG